jgi:succinate dehydrogenase / fumarate reductase iron-sulfur subunit
MVELTLPKNSTMTEGKVWPKPEGAKNLREYRIYRWSPDDGKNPRSTPIMSMSTIAARWCSTR